MLLAIESLQNHSVFIFYFFGKIESMKKQTTPLTGIYYNFFFFQMGRIGVLINKNKLEPIVEI